MARSLFRWLPFPSASTRWAARRRRAALRIVERSDQLRGLDESRLLELSRDLRWRCLSGEPLARLLPEAFALVRESSRRACGLAHHPVQLIGGMALVSGAVAEMQTGEGKTLTALLAVYLQALAGKGCHVVTANDYLASRDAELARGILGRLGLTVGCVDQGLSTRDRRGEYSRDITYGTAREMGFDALRDKLRGLSSPRQSRGRGDVAAQGPGAGSFGAAAPAEPTLPGHRFLPHPCPSPALVRERGIAESPCSDHAAFPADGLRLLQAVASPPPDDESAPVQRGHHFALVDEADSILIDDARTPLLIAVGEPPDAASLALYRWTMRAIPRLEPADFTLDAKRRDAHLTEEGCRRLLRMPRPAALDGIDVERLYRQTERALVAAHCFAVNRDYVVIEGEVAIVDESTGRLMEGRKWQDGLHQAVEAKERIEITESTCTAARITVQSFFRGYTILAGMTGTASSASAEFRRVYGLPIRRIPTHRPGRRVVRSARVFRSQTAKSDAIALEIEHRRAVGQAVLVGTPSVAASERLAAALDARGISCAVLNCREHRREAEIVSLAGQPGRVTIATNMAGRGTDIKAHPDVLAKGGLHVIATEMHSSARIDRQLVGRTARQGEPGSCQFFLSLEDELLSVLPRRTTERLRARGARESDSAGELPRGWSRLFRRVQRRVERLHARQRRRLLSQEKKRTEACRRMGLDPCLDVVE